MSKRDTQATAAADGCALKREMRTGDAALQRTGASGGSHWLDHPRNVSKLYYAVWVCGLVLVLLDFVMHRHDPIAFAEMPGFYAAYGFIACVLLVLTAKSLRRLLMRPEDYYEC